MEKQLGHSSTMPWAADSHSVHLELLDLSLDVRLSE